MLPTAATAPAVHSILQHSIWCSLLQSPLSSGMDQDEKRRSFTRVHLVLTNTKQKHLQQQQQRRQQQQQQHWQLEICGRAQRKATRRRKSDCRDIFGWFKCRSQKCHLGNQSGKLSEIAPKFHLGVSTFAPITFCLWTKVHHLFFAQCGRGCSWSTTFPIFDMLIRSGDIRDRSR